MKARNLWAVVVAVVLILQCATAGAQQNIPDAPSTKQKPQNFPAQPYPPAQTAPSTEPAPAAQSQPPASSTTKPAPPLAGDSSSTQAPPEQTPTAPPPTPQVGDVPSGRAPAADQASRNELFTLTKSVNFVVVPVTVKDQNGRLVDGLLKKDFAIYEDGNVQPIQLFTSDPFPLSAAIVVDTGLPDTVLEKVQNTLAALTGAFSQFDELAVYTYGDTVQRLDDYTTLPDQIAAMMRHLKMKNERERRTGSQGVTFAGGPFNTQGPVINGKPVDPTQSSTPIARQDTRALNDAVLMAAQDLSRRDRTRRRLIFVISDGQERGSKTSYADCLKVLLSNEVTVYAMAVGAGAVPGYSTLQRIRIPGQGYNDILPKYASATGGEVIKAGDTKAIENAYTRTTEQARNQYTIGYSTRVTPSEAYREIEVRVHRQGLTVKAKTGYYPLPPQRSTAAPTSQP